VVIHSPDGDSIAVFYRDVTQRAPSEVWGNHFASLVAPETVNLWLSEKLGRALC
ncbi:MAG TPA: MOSC domain-containing protein, partial [Plesiomonas shigelloides]|nr:MOSC domain-containing protein [Plesiomonas shigelloides]